MLRRFDRRWAALAAGLSLLFWTLPAAAQLSSAWTVTVNGQKVQVNPDGTFSIPNVSAADRFGAGGPGSPPDFFSDDFLRLTGVSTVDGVTRYVFSEPFQIFRGQAFVVGGLTFTDTPPPVPQSIRLTVDSPTLTGLGQTTQVRTEATLADGSVVDVTPHSSWTSYRTSNPGIATIDQDGQVTATGTGIAFLTATNDGATTVARVAVAPGDPLTAVEGIVVLADGSPAGGATVELPGLGRSTQTAEGGSFSIPGVPTTLGALSVFARATIGGKLFTATASGLQPVPGGITDAGILTLEESNVLTLTPPNPSEFGGSAAPDGGVVFERGAFLTALADFSITSLGIEADPTTSSITLVANIYAASGLFRGSRLATAAMAFSDAGTSFYDVPIDFTFQAGQDYDVAINFLPSASILVRFFNFDPGLFGSPPFDVGGVVRVRDGEAAGGASNFVLPHLRFNGRSSGMVGLAADPPPAPVPAAPGEAVAGEPEP